MSRLIQIMRNYVTVKGKADLCKAAGKCERMIDRYLKGETVPSAQVRYRLARQCGCTHEVALKIANEGTSEAKKAG
jgi:transcriptional regulator with XRE-family HTH domain